VLLNYHIGRFVLGSLCVGDLVWLGLSGVRVAGLGMRFCQLSTPSLPSHSFSKLLLNLHAVN